MDIEAIRDERVWSPPTPPPRGTVRNVAGDVIGSVEGPLREFFPPPYAWRPICIGCVLISVDKGKPAVVERIGVIDVPKEGDPDSWEVALLNKFADALSKYQEPEIVTWNGRHFDLPVLLLRSMRHGVQHPWYYRSKEARYRYSEDRHCDLADHMSDHGAADRLALDGIAKTIGLPGKFGDIDGAGVEAAFAGGRHTDIAGYCLSDAVQLAFAFLRWQLLKGAISLASYRSSATQFLSLCSSNAALAGEFMNRVDRKTLLLSTPESATEAA